MKILVGVTGGIAAYKAAELVRELQRNGAEVQVLMTPAAEKFITPLTFAALTGKPVLTSVWQMTDTVERFEIEHISVTQGAEAFVIAPATANTLAKLAHGLADDMVSTTALAATCPLIVAPAMNVNMWHSAATQENLATLRARGVLVVEPASGELACGMVGEGRLAEPAVIADVALRAAVGAESLAGETILITSGGTREPIDAVRFLTNRSSGRMGFALAQEALARGASVVYVTAAKEAPQSSRCRTVRVNTAAEMHEAARAALPEATAVFMAAAVSDYRVETPSTQKQKKSANLTLELVQNPDILRDLASHRDPETTLIGFAAETEHVLEEGRRKLQDKGLDALFANDVSSAESGFDVDRNGGTLILLSGEKSIPQTSKREVARRLLDALPEIRRAALLNSVSFVRQE
ncbi:MAG: bifunctional phosphopantothenoylcysteine decarboxylase/phosphopantothenate--cysteine ligase CoaBC [Acidobacteriaceae bacterium]|nr:bifunctional phosphopantothenoylcysteine decarboxylase/phosphopantothenate--cysteine ligase CoaBC [Acidobacteriaceae bacterium]